MLKQLDSAWTTRDALTAEDWEREAAETKRLRDDLNGVVDLLHRPDPSGWTIHRAIGRTVKDAGEATPRFAFPAGTKHAGEEMAHLRDVARRLGIAHKAVVDLPKALDGVTCTDWSNGWQEEIVATAGGLPQAIDAALEAHRGIEAVTRLPLPGSDRAQLEAFATFADLCLSMHGHDFRFAFGPDMAARVIDIRDAMALIARYRSEEAALSASYAPEAARRIDLTGIQAQWTAAEGKFWLFATFAKRKVARALAQAGGAGGDVDPQADLPRLAAMRDLLGKIDGLASGAAAIPGWAGLATDAERVEQAIGRAERLRGAVAAEASGPDMLVDLRRATSTLLVDANDMLAEDGPVAGAAHRLRASLERLDTATISFVRLSGHRGETDFGSLRSSADAIVAHGRRLREWTIWRRVREEAINAGLLPLVDALERGGVEPGTAVNVFEVAYARWFAFTRMDAEPLLKNFMAGEQEDRIERFRALDERMGELSSRYIRAKLCGLIPDKNDVGKKDGYGTLKHQLQLQRPSMPIRRLAAEMGDAFTRLAPCMLMSPLSIAQYLPADQALFDLVIFDEASQITPWDAIGAMARGRQVVIAGDPRQMPPSNDFARGSGTATVDDDTVPDMESILDECLAAGVPCHSLDWHYRSRHESLICFSNTRYYKSQLVTFPAPETRPSAVSWQRVPGVYTSGARTNPIEAQAIVDEAVRRLRNPGFVDEKGKPLTLGIITMNAEQMRLVEDLLDKAQRAYPEIVPHFDQERLEPVCIRNLETVQGDERDVILYGVNFGPTEPGGKTMSMSFGKLNASGGWRRLNVATTRARREMKVLTSFDPGMIDLTRTAAEGVRDLKAFIEFADRGPRALAEATRGSLGGADSPFEEAVTAALRKRGWTVVPQVGVSKFRIDLGIVHPDRPGDYLVGVECDGAAYHSAATARDRDKVRATILEGLGWTLVRTWSTDWWVDRERAADRLHAQIEARLTSYLEAAQERAAAAAAAAVIAAAAAPILPEMDLVSIPTETDEAEIATEAVEAPVAAALSDERVETVAAPAYARLVEADSSTAGVLTPDDGLYRTTDFTSVADRIEPQHFYEPSYDGVLATLIRHVLAAEAPIAEMLLVQRIARAHGFQRAGRVIRERVMALVDRLHFVEAEVGGSRFVWADEPSRDGWDRARMPASEEDIRQIEEISLRELRTARRDQGPVEIARGFGVRRLSSMARSRIEASWS